ncbi:hypothetical protein EX895_000360 [Sporisorium graminicola]|uniref:Uncharacterized protein n=1 Tax=Sporisorium graminicola TaxID=280036 RepID=A0A4U7L4J3_9BASI|nr:hypothetical protein EX895_000360 [Sporisorium graminicola]TKY90362.1 hypothetical protein EX895_000360 [Sporisorium graminicola]
MDGTVKFFGVTDGTYNTARLATHPELATRLSLAPLSNQKLNVPKNMWKSMGLRLLFAQSTEVAFALIEAQMLKSAFPTMLDEDKQKLQDGNVTMIKIEKKQRTYIYRLFSVLNLDMIRQEKP